MVFVIISKIITKPKYNSLPWFRVMKLLKNAEEGCKMNFEHDIKSENIFSSQPKPSRRKHEKEEIALNSKKPAVYKVSTFPAHPIL